MYLHVFDRSDTYSIEHASKACRTDVVLMNGTRSDSEYTLHVTENGFSGDMWLLDVLDNERYDRLQVIAERMRANAKIYPDCQKLLGE